VLRDGDKVRPDGLTDREFWRFVRFVLLMLAALAAIIIPIIIAADKS